MRGLKHICDGVSVKITEVAPFTGAWIETPVWFDSAQYFEDVAPFTDAWIETKNNNILVKITPSRTLHGCVD